jgi:Kef-type K+ transport system membrane component KefB
MISVSGIITVIDRYGAKGNISSALTNVSVISLNLSLLLYGIMFCVFQYNHLSVKPGTLTEWVLASIFIATLLGILFFVFLGREENPNKLLVSVIGITIFAGGAAYYINFSPFVMNFIIGAVLANLAKNKNKLRDSLHALRYPFEILVIISAGFFWAIPNFLIFISTIALFIIIRFISIYIAGKFAYKTAFDKEDVHPDIWQGLLPQGIVTAALAADYSISFKNEFMTVILSAILGSLIFFELISYVRIKNLLVDAAEISGEKK